MPQHMRGVHIPGVNNPHHSFLIVDRSRRLLKTVSLLVNVRLGAELWIKKGFILIALRKPKLNGVLAFLSAVGLNIL